MASYLYPLSDECGTTAPWENTDARKILIDRRQKAKVKNEKLKAQNQGITVKSRVRKRRTCYDYEPTPRYSSQFRQVGLDAAGSGDLVQIVPRQSGNWAVECPAQNGTWSPFRSS
jgi:hypothetical protein